MADSRRVVRVFLASPGDLPDERRTAKSVVDEFNQLLADAFGYQAELVGWEDTVSVFGRPQAVINRDLERCELFVGLMWKRWGTPPDNSGTYTSGFQEEFEKSVKRRLDSGQPEISLFFKEIGPEFLDDPGEELKKVQAFRDRLISEKIILFENFSDIQDFEKKFRRCITTYILSLKAQQIDKVSDQSQAPSSGDEKPQAKESTSTSSETPLSVEGTKFLREFILKTEQSSEQQPIEAVEIARFRLLASLVGTQNNDPRYLGVHDANLLFSKKSDFTFGHRELAGLLACGLDHYSQENTPLWHWLAAIDGLAHGILSLYSFIGPTAKRVGTLKAMRLISEPLDSELERKRYLDSWFSGDATSDLKVAALGYLGDCGITSDLTTIRQEFDKGDNQTVSTAADVIIRVNFRESREKAILALFELQPTSVDKSLLTILFANEATLETGVLLQGVGHPNSGVRRIVVELLRKRRALTNEIAEQLMTDTEASVRYEALKVFVDSGRTFSDDEAKKILVKQNTGGGFGLIALSMSDTAGETCWEDFKLRRLRLLKDKELEEILSKDTVFDLDAKFILTERHFKQYAEDLRKSVDDQYKTWYVKTFSSMVERFGEYAASFKEKMASFEDYIRRDATRKGLDILCHKATPGDLGRVRTALKSGFINYSDSDVEYLRKFGEWEDIELIIDCVGRPEAGRSSLLLSVADNSKYRIPARTIYALGKARLPEVLAMPAPSMLLSHLVFEIPDKVFRNLKDGSITLLLQLQNDDVRKATALKCVRALSKARLAKLLAGYISGEQQRYYNVIHWLDFGISVSKDRALRAVEKVINKEWRN